MKNQAIFYARVATTLILVIICSVVMLLFSIATLFLFRRKNFVWIMKPFAQIILRLWGLRLEVLPAVPVPKVQTVFLMNHTSTIDMFAVIAMGIPNNRFFLWGGLRKFPPFAVLGYLTGTFWTVGQAFPERRARIFQRACDTLKRTGESVCLSPEGRRVTTGKIGPFNKGSFHLAAALKAPVQPLFIEITNESNPGTGWNTKGGKIRIWVAEPIDTSSWRPEDAGKIKEDVRQFYVDWKHRLETQDGQE